MKTEVLKATICVGGLKASNVEYTKMSDMEAEELPYPIDGVLGLVPLTGRKIGEQDYPAPPLNDILSRTDLVRAPQFSTWFGKSEGEIVFGGVNPERFTGPISKCADLDSAQIVYSIHSCRS